MLLLTLAAFAQGATGQTSPREQLMTCAAATLAAPEGGLGARVSAAWYVVATMRADPRPGVFYRRFADLTTEATAQAPRYRDGGALAGRAEAIRSECDRSYPEARSRDAAHLPDDPVERNILCYSTIVFLRALGTSEPAEVHPLRARLDETERTLEGRLPGDAGLIRRSDELMVASVELGNAETISQACLAEPGG